MQPTPALNWSTTAVSLSQLVGYAHAQVTRLAYHVPDGQRYQLILRPKRDGTSRVIAAPYPRLKSIQTRLAALLSDLYWPSSRAHGFIAGRGLRTNAAPHLGKRYILNVDIEDFFGSINFGRVRGRLLAPPYSLSNDAATTIAKLCTYQNGLPLGAPTSPVLSNMICSSLDAELREAARKHGCFYTRYADDLTFSSNRRRFPDALGYIDQGDDTTAHVAGSELSQIVGSAGFKLNTRKTRLLSRSERLEVCGITCNERLNVRRNLYREIRAILHAWQKFGYAATEDRWKEKYNYRKASNLDAFVRGKLSFLVQIRGPNDRVTYKYVERYNALRQHSKAFRYDLDADWKEQLRHVSCCIHSYNLAGSGDMVQGSGFVVEGGYIVTNDHVVVKDAKPYDLIELSLPGSLKVDLPVEIAKRNAQSDLAILRVTDKSWRDILRKNVCQLGAGEVVVGQIVTLTGWPSYNDGDEVHIASGSVTGHSYPNGVKVFRINPSIVFGNSGGPVFNEAGAVIGVATRGSDVGDAPLNVHNGCVPIAAVHELLQSVLEAESAQAAI